MTTSREESMAIWLRQKGWTVTPPKPDATLVAPKMPPTSQYVIPRLNQESLLAMVYRTIAVHGSSGLTDFEVERWTGHAHQTVSAARNTLVRRGLLYNTGRTRQNNSGNPCIVWARTDIEPTMRTKKGTA